MKRENQAKFKELNKVLMKIAKPYAKQYGFKTKDYIMWFVKNGFFFTLFLHISAKNEDCYFSSKLSAKPLYADDLLWDILDMPENKKEPLSLRAVGAFSLFGVPVSEAKIKMSALEVPILERLIKDTIDDLSKTLSMIKGNEEDWFYLMERRHASYFQSDDMRLMIKLHFKQYQEAIDFIKGTNNTSGGFSAEGKDIFDRVAEYCSLRV